jgi:uncharacterized OsmC-like protein
MTCQRLGRLSKEVAVANRREFSRDVGLAHAAVRGIEIQELESELEGDIDLRGFLGLASDVPKGYSQIRLKFKVKTDEQNMERLKSLATFSPVYNSLINGVKMGIQVEPK